MMEVNWIAVLVAAISAFVLGGLWYGPLFGKKWLAYNGMTEEEAQSGHPVKIFGGAFLLSLVAAFVFAMFLGPKPGLQFAVLAGLAAGLCWVAATFGINYLFARRPFGLWLIDGGYATAQFALYGVAIGALS
ncbi:DUF1761 domain-containing protein [Parerythrobacter jejuensis]|uniref:DUF1761 family protein n=1 Tax=Parerythrobacter jejuensis TaxID=795812 RepID=A0A845ANQ4_9SPHN|nr:DUF1761 domain-containing protein [Parerythrobacter jejuensis]MXP30535.1 DUF1761 family protein [Parerythrobacter jejuensis]MXP33295.1 DUF1761 family protein [Parerythrobacter jejuensis]